MNGKTTKLCSNSTNKINTIIPIDPTTIGHTTNTDTDIATTGDTLTYPTITDTTITPKKEPVSLSE